jgi:signal transduction histidine kinase
MRYVPLKTKYIGGVCCLILFVFVELLVFMRLKFTQRMESELHKRGVSIARNLAVSASTPILTENRIALQLLVNETKTNEEDLRYIYIVNPQGKLLAHTFGQTFPAELLKLDRPLPDSEKQHIQTIQTEEEQLEDVTVLIHQGDFGRVHIGLSKDIIKQEQKDLILHGAPIVGLILLFGIAFSCWFAVKITGPLSRLSDSVNKVGAGDFDGEIDIVSNDEIGELSHSFNTMLQQLRELTAEQLRTHTELRMQTDMLEAEIAERQMVQEQLSVKQIQLEALNRSLEERIGAAVDELRLKDRVMLAQGRQAAMGEMINNIAHQWRQPLNNLGLIVQSIKTEFDTGTLTPEDLAADVAKTMKTLLFMSQTINDFSNFFSIDKARVTFNVLQGIHKVIAMMEASISKQGIAVRIEKVDDVSIEGYLNEYNQVLLNLLNNAKDILVERSTVQPVIHITVLRNGDNAVVKIRDNAGGIPDEIIGRIFDPYFTTKEKDKGSGVGLYMSKIIIQEHFGGSLTAANEDGGAEFTVSTGCTKALI